MSALYLVHTWGAERSYATFAEALAGYVEMSAQYPRLPVFVQNNDRCDYDSNGLTADERDALLEAL